MSKTVYHNHSLPVNSSPDSSQSENSTQGDDLALPRAGRKKWTESRPGGQFSFLADCLNHLEEEGWTIYTIVPGRGWHDSTVVAHRPYDEWLGIEERRDKERAEERRRAEKKAVV
jgi:hypothetical protein